MNWLTEQNQDRIYIYKSECGKIIKGNEERIRGDFHSLATFKAGDSFVLRDVKLNYAGFEEPELRIMVQRQFDKNGRTATETRFAKGNTYSMSDSKRNLLEGKKGSDGGYIRGITKRAKEALLNRVKAEIKEFKRDAKNNPPKNEV